MPDKLDMDFGSNVSQQRGADAGTGDVTGGVVVADLGVNGVLLGEEGVEAVWNGTVWTVDLKKYGWKNTLEEAEELAALFCGA